MTSVSDAALVNNDDCNCGLSFTCGLCGPQCCCILLYIITHERRIAVWRGIEQRRLSNYETNCKWLSIVFGIYGFIRFSCRLLTVRTTLVFLKKDDIEKKRVGMFDRRQSWDIGKGAVPLSSYCYAPNNSSVTFLSCHFLLSSEKLDVVLHTFHRYK